jgi:hypothetical protein
MAYRREDIVKRTIQIPAINAGCIKQYTELDDELKSIISHYGYMTGFQLINNSGAEILLKLDGMRIYDIPSAMSMGDDNTQFTWFEIENKSAGTDIGDKLITITLLNEATTDRFMNRFSRGLMNMKFKKVIG